MDKTKIYNYTMEYYSAITKDKLMSFTERQTELKGITLLKLEGKRNPGQTPQVEHREINKSTRNSQN